MTLIDEWDFQGPSSAQVGAQDFSEAGLDDLQDVPTSPGLHPDAGLCTLEPLDRQLARGRGRVTGAAVASECLLVVTSRAVLLRFDFSVGMTPVSDVELSRAPDASATAVRVDDAGSHALVSIKSGNTLGSTAEHLYIYSKWKKAKSIPKLKGTNITAAAWNAATASEGWSGPVIVGDDKGQLLEVILDEKEKRDPPVKPLYSFEDAPERITGLQQHLAQQRTLVLVATATRLYVFVGDKDLEPLFASYPPSAADLQNYIQAPEQTSAVNGGLLETWAPLGSHTSSRFAWLSAAGLQHGRLRLDLKQRPPSDIEYLAMEPEMITLADSGEQITHMAMTEFHYIMLDPRTLRIYNRISGQPVQELAMSGPDGVLPSSQGTFSMLLRDAEAAQTYLMAGENLLEVVIDNEEKDLWHAFLQKGNHAMAVRYANTQAERDTVSRSEAEAAFRDGDYKHAARLWGRMQGGDPSFEETALRFVEVGATDALQVFLMARLQVLAPDDKAQATMVASWIVELHLDQINRAMLEESSEANSRSEAHTEALRAFLKDHVEILDVNVTISLLASYGRMDDLMHYATYRQDSETLLEYLLQRGEESRALAVLRRPNISHELMFKFAPALLAAVPGDTINAWIACKPPLDPRRLLPALISACEASQDRNLQSYALRFVEHCISHESTDTTLHNLAVSLYSQDADEQRLLHYLRSARGTLGSPLYDPQFALQVARQHSKLNACVQLLCELGLHEDAVALALTFDRAAATAVAANASDGDEALQRKLWLAIARHLIFATSNGPDTDPKERVAAVVEVLGEAEGQIRIEDVLPLFPDFVTIDAFKAAICASLEDYNAQIEGLKTEMADSTRIADALRKDITALESQAATLDLSELCACCGRQIGGLPPASVSSAPAALPQFYLFPTGNAFHGACLAKEVMAAAAPQQQKAISALIKQLSQDFQEQPDGTAQDVERRRVLCDKLEKLIAHEDPYNGESVVRIISKGFDSPSVESPSDDWKI